MSTRPEPPRQELAAEPAPGRSPRAVGAFAPRSRRLALAYGYVGAVALAAGAALGLRDTASAAVQLGAVVVMAATWVALRRATRMVADGPDEALDDVLVRLRHRIFVLAYQMLAVVALGVAVCLLLFSGGGIGEELATGLAWAVLGSALGLPLVVSAVALPERS